MNTDSRVAIIVAAAENGVIGRNNALPWHLPEDLRYFRAVTMGKPIIMGRKTFEAIGKPLPGRTNIVITRDRAFKAEGVRGVGSLEEAMSLASQVALIDGIDEVAVIGGAQVYESALPLADRLYVTEVHASIEGDAVLPPIAWSEWAEISRERHRATDSNPYDYSFVVYDRVSR